MPPLLLLLAGLGYQFPFTHINVCRGYGDWNDWAEFHTGLDFRCGVDEWAMNPYWDTQTPAYVLRSFYNEAADEWIVFMVPDLNDDTGWAYEHMYEDSIGMYEPDSTFLPPFPSDPPSFYSTVGRCQDNPQLGRHLHMCLMDETNWGTPPPGYVNPQPGYFNPFDELPVPLGYDTALFDTVYTY